MPFTVELDPIPFARVYKAVRPVSITEITVHGTGGASNWGSSTQERSFLGWLHSSSSRRNLEGRAVVGVGIFHYAIGRQGQILQFLDDNVWCNHSQSGNHDKETIGVELLNSRRNRGTYTGAQMDTLTQLICNKLLPAYSTINKITGHRKNILKYSPNYARTYPHLVKNCPGRTFDWDVLKKRIEGYDYGVTITLT